MHRLAKTFAATLEAEPELRAAYEAGRLRFTDAGLLEVVYPLCNAGHANPILSVGLAGIVHASGAASASCPREDFQQLDLDAIEARRANALALGPWHRIYQDTLNDEGDLIAEIKKLRQNTPTDPQRQRPQTQCDKPSAHLNK